MPARRPIRLVAPALIIGTLLVCALVHAPTALLAQEGADEYRELLAQYERGQTEEAVQALAAHEPAWVASAVAGALRDARGWTPRQTRAAVLLHTDAVVDGWVPPSRVSTHLDAARRLADLQKGAVVGRDFRRDWLLVVTWFLHAEADLGSAQPWVDLLLADYPADGDALVTAGAYFEASAWNDGQPELLDRALAIYKRMPTDSPAAAQARVRLGRTWLELHRPADALRSLDAVRAGPGDDAWRYLAWLFSAAAEASTRRYAAAAEAYTQAAELLPSCQTALIGLAAVRRAEGRLDDAAALVARLAVMDISHCDDPWWHYRFGQTPERRARLLLSMRAMVTKP